MNLNQIQAVHTVAGSAGRYGTTKAGRLFGPRRKVSGRNGSLHGWYVGITERKVSALRCGSRSLSGSTPAVDLPAGTPYLAEFWGSGKVAATVLWVAGDSPHAAEWGGAIRGLIDV